MILYHGSNMSVEHPKLIRQQILQERLWKEVKMARLP